ncbi:hypothetical protein G6656_01960 [Polynucleobacter paneuropaeus]|nr:hypothetical protein [Polynucleobacter paneuropaeus]
MNQFLTDLNPRPLNQGEHGGIKPVNLYLGKGTNALEVAFYQSPIKPNTISISKVWTDRKAGRSSPILTVIQYPDGVALCGPSGDQPPIFHINDLGQAERISRAALLESDRHAAIRFLTQALPSLETQLPGITNEGLFALHALSENMAGRADWVHAKELAKKAVDKSNIELLKALGFSIERLDNLTNLLKSQDRRTALAVMLQEGEIEETGLERFNNLSPVSYALTKADKEGLPWVVFIQGNRIRLYSTKNIGVGRRGRTETYIECQPTLLSDNDLSYLWLLFSADALTDSGSVESLIADSKRFSGALAERLRERIYDIVVPELAAGISEARNLTKPTSAEISLTYEMALIVLFRLLFIAYAEDRDLLPYKVNELYRRRSLKQKAEDLSVTNDEEIANISGHHHWIETEQLFDAVYQGNKEWGVPVYDGTIFSSNKSISLAGYELKKIKIKNIFFEKALKALLTTETSENNVGPVDFRSLSVREFGTIYEGLLESELSLAEQNLSRDKNGNYLPAKDGKEIFIKKGQVYLHDRSGARKSSGSYYTPDFAVEYLLDIALEPALVNHIDRLADLDEVAAAESFFDFRIADIAMGSGHFLVAAIDRIEKRFSEVLESRRLPGVIKELNELRIAAMTQLKDYSEHIAIEDSQLLRRLIARRCVYGVDLNPLAVQLSRLSIWIHSFVPGLPLSLLDHNLVYGNSLVGIGSLEQVTEKFNEASDNFALSQMFAIDSEALLNNAAEPLRKLAKLADGTIKDIERGRKLISEAQETTQPINALCDLIIAQPISNDEKLKAFPFEEWEERKGTIQNSHELRVARKLLEPFKVIHFPLVFPEVFLRPRKGFDVILGNPPWEEVKPEERDFWTGHFPGLRGIPQREQELRWVELKSERPDLARLYEISKKQVETLSTLLSAGNYPGIEVGDADLYKAFAWRFWNLLSSLGGYIGVVLPRSSMSAKGSEEFRKALFQESETIEIASLVNNKKWIFSNVHPQYTICLVSIYKKANESHEIKLSGPFRSLEDFSTNKNYQAKFSTDEILTWNESASIPLLPSAESIDVFAKLRQSPWLSINTNEDWRVRPDTELHATAQKPLMDFTDWRARPDRELDATLQKNLMNLESEVAPEGYWPVYKGESFDIWSPDTKTYYAWANPDIVLPWLYDKRLRSNRSSRNSAHGEFSHNFVLDKKTLAPLKPRIAFRLITRSTDTRTCRVALVPPKVFLTNAAQYLLFPRGDEFDEAYLLGVLSSIPLDWYARRYVEVNFNFYLFNPLPIPRPNRSNPLWKKVVQLSGRLASVDERYSGWAKKIEVEYGHLDEKNKEQMINELDAVVAHLYGLTAKDLTHIFETFHEGWDYKPRLKAVLDFYKAYK